MYRDENNLKRYLLGTLAEKEQLLIEQKIMLDDEVFEQLLIAEDELTDAYVRQTLSSAERLQFERHFLSAPEHRQKLHFAQALQRQLDSTAESVESSQPGWLQSVSDFFRASYPVRGYALGAACTLIAVGGGGLGYKLVSLQSEVTQMRAALSAPQSSEQELRQQLTAARASTAQLEQALESSRAQTTQLEKAIAQAVQSVQPVTSPAASAVVAFVLTPGALTRGAGASNSNNQLIIPLGARTAKLQLELERDQYPSYRAVLHAQGGTTLKSWDATSPQQTAEGKRLQLSVPVALLPAGSYYFQLVGFTADGHTEKADQFHFRVTQK